MGKWGGGAKDSGEEKRIHPSDKDKKAYSYAEFKQFSNGDEKKANKMWGESKPAGSNDQKSWDQKADSAWRGKDNKSWDKKDDSWNAKDSKGSGAEKRVH